MTTPREAVQLAGYLRAHFPHQPIDEYTADALGELLEPYPAVDAKTAILAIAKRGERWCAPADIAAEVRRVRSKRLAEVGDLCPPPGLTQQQERDWLRVARKRIGDGEVVEVDFGELKPRHLPDLRAITRRTDDEGTSSA